MRGIRNNNPLNIRHSADKWQGARIAQTDKAFVQFQSMAYGYRAAWKILDTYCLRFKRERKTYNVRNIIGRWAPPTENDTDAYIRAVVKLSGLGGNENMPRPKHYRAFDEVDKLVRLIMAMTCVENGMKWEEVDREAIWEGYRLAFPGVRPPDGRQDDKDEEIPHNKNVLWDEYWEWSPQVYKP